MKIALKIVIIAGDSYDSIAANINASVGISYQDIEATNPDVTPQSIQPEQIILIPAHNNKTIDPWQYTILPGDSFSSIAKGINQCKGLTGQDIEQTNNTPARDLKIGQTIDIPASKAANTPPPVVTAQNISYWDKTYFPGNALPGATMGIAFSGWSDVNKAINDSKIVYGNLTGEKYISIGGGKETGRFTKAVLEQVNNAIRTNQFKNYTGLAYDVEVGDPGLAADFSQSFAFARKNNLKVLVTISHSAPYGIADQVELMEQFITDDNINFLSPQLYTHGDEKENDYADPLFPWTSYRECKADILVSIVTADLYQNAQSYFEKLDIELKGYIQWANVS